MNPCDVKIWIGGCWALHTSICDELTTIVPRRVSPDPLNWRSRCPLVWEEATLVESVAEDFVDFAGACSVCEVEVLLVASVELPAAVELCAAVLFEPLPAVVV
jgi:hypothetical protein